MKKTRNMLHSDDLVELCTKIPKTVSECFMNCYFPASHTCKDVILIFHFLQMIFTQNCFQRCKSSIKPAQ